MVTQFNDFVKKIGAAVHKDQLPGGLADDKDPSDFSQEQIRKGIKVELEHTDDRAKAREIAMDHLTEDPKYYDKLLKMEGKSHGSSGKSKHAKESDRNKGYQHGQYIYESGPWMTDLSKRITTKDVAKKLPKKHTDAFREGVMDGVRAQRQYVLRDLYHFGHDSQFASEFNLHNRYKGNEKLLKQHALGALKDYGHKPGKITGRSGDLAKISTEGESKLDVDPNSTIDVVSPKTPVEKLQMQLDSYIEEKEQLERDSTDPDTGEFAGTPEQAERMEKLQSVIDGMRKVIRQRKYNIKDTLTHRQKAVMQNDHSNRDSVQDYPLLTDETKVAMMKTALFGLFRRRKIDSPVEKGMERLKRYEDHINKVLKPYGHSIDTLPEQMANDFRAATLQHVADEMEGGIEADDPLKYQLQAVQHSDPNAAGFSWFDAGGEEPSYGSELAEQAEKTWSKYKGKTAGTKRKVSPHGFEVVFGETNKATNNEPETIKGESNLLAVLGRNEARGHDTSRSPDHAATENPGFVGHGNPASHPAKAAQSKDSPYRAELKGNKLKEKKDHAEARRLYEHSEADYEKDSSMDAYEKRAAAVLNSGSTLVNPDELRVTFFFEGLADSLEKQGYVVSKPVEFFTGMYESLREHFEGPTKLASGVYPDYVANACSMFEERMEKLADMSQLTPVNPLDPNAAQQAQENALGVSPQRQEKRQDIIDSLLPHAETIQLDPDGKIKLKMPSPEAAGVMDPQVMQQQQMAEQDGRAQAEQAAAAGAEGEGMLPEGMPPEGGEQLPEGMPENAETPMTGGDFDSQAQLIQALMGAGGSPAMVGAG